LDVVLSGEEIAERSTDSYNIILVQLENFYVEVYCDKDFEAIISFHAFDSLEELNPYLEHIEIEI
jgi:hypothetical protein